MDCRVRLEVGSGDISDSRIVAGVRRLRLLRLGEAVEDIGEVEVVVGPVRVVVVEEGIMREMLIVIGRGTEIVASLLRVETLLHHRVEVALVVEVGGESIGIVRRRRRGMEIEIETEVGIGREIAVTGTLG